MAFGDILVQLIVPEKPSGSALSESAYIDAVTAAVDTYLTTLGIKDAIPSWANRTDLPDSEFDAPDFVEDRLADAGVDTSLYAFSLANRNTSDPATLYCLIGEILRCYGTVKVAPKVSTTPNEFAVTVSIDNGLSVSVVLNFVVRPILTFPT